MALVQTAMVNGFFTPNAYVRRCRDRGGAAVSVLYCPSRFIRLPGAGGACRPHMFDVRAVMFAAR